MNKLEMDDFILSVKSDMTFYLADLNTKRINYYWTVDPEEEGRYSCEFKFVAFKKYGIAVAGNDSEEIIGLLKIGFEDRQVLNSTQTLRVPIIEYSTTSLWFGLHLAKMLMIALKTSALPKSMKNFASRYLFGLENQVYLIEKLRDIEEKYHLTVTAGGTNFSDDDEKYKSQVLMNDPFDRSLLLDFNHPLLQYNKEELNEFELDYALHVQCGENEALDSGIILITKTDNNLGYFEQILAGDMSP